LAAPSLQSSCAGKFDDVIIGNGFTIIVAAAELLLLQAAAPPYAPLLIVT
jgi:hypothetical protein